MARLRDTVLIVKYVTVYSIKIRKKEYFARNRKSRRKIRNKEKIDMS